MAGTRISRRSMLGTVGAASLVPVLLKASDGPPAGSAPPDALPHAAPAYLARFRVSPIAPHAAQPRAVAIIGGTVEGTRLSGVVESGSVEWQQYCDGMAVTAHYSVRRADGSVVEVRERGMQSACTGIHGASGMSLVSELSGPDVETCALPALRVGRLDTTRLHQGEIRLLAFEVS